jgi:hypothetical protein
MKLFGSRTGRWFNKFFKIEDTYYYYSSKEEYYKSLFREADMKSLYVLLDKNLHPPVIANPAIKFRDIEFGAALSDVLKKLGSPRYKINNSQGIETHQVFFYKFKMGGYRTVAQLHFLNNFFFYANYTFKDLNNANLKKIEEVLENKYFNTVEGNGLGDQVVADTDNNRLFVNKGLYLTIKYVSGNRKFHDDVIHQMQTRQEKKQQAEKRQHESLQGSL